MLISVGVLGLVSSLDPMRPMVLVVLLRAECPPGSRPSGSSSAGPSQRQSCSASGSPCSTTALSVAPARRTRSGSRERPARAGRRPPGRGVATLAAKTRTSRRSTRASCTDPTTTRPTHPATFRVRRRAHPTEDGDDRGCGHRRSRPIRPGRAAGFGLLVFALFSTGAILGLFTYFVRRPDSAATRLTDLGDRMEQMGPQILTLGCALACFYLIFDGIRGIVNG